MAKRNKLSEKFNAVRKLAEKHSKELFAIPGAYEVGYGYRYKDGQWTNTPAIIVTVGSKEVLTKLLLKERIPTKFAGVPVDIIAIDVRPHQYVDPDQRQDPLVGGLSISNGRFSSGRGTMGAIVYKDGTNKPLGLTNHHVLCHWQVFKKSKRGDAITQPGYTKPSTSTTIGKLAVWSDKFDAAAFYLTDRRSINEQDPLNGISGRVKGILRAEPGTNVKKAGTRTGLTYGTVMQVLKNKDGCEYAKIVANPSKPAPNGEISQPGDSGALWVTDTPENLAVALHNRGETVQGEEKEWAAGVLIGQVLTALKVHF